MPDRSIYFQSLVGSAMYWMRLGANMEETFQHLETNPDFGGIDTITLQRAVEDARINMDATILAQVANDETSLASLFRDNAELGSTVGVRFFITILDARGVESTKSITATVNASASVGDLEDFLTALVNSGEMPGDWSKYGTVSVVGRPVIHQILVNPLQNALLNLNIS